MDCLTINCFTVAGTNCTAFYFSAISASGPGRRRRKRAKTSVEANFEISASDDESGDDGAMKGSQAISNTTTTWVSENKLLVDKKLRPGISYWIAMTTPNGAPANPLIVQRALLECGVEATANQVFGTI